MRRVLSNTYEAFPLFSRSTSATLLSPEMSAERQACSSEAACLWTLTTLALLGSTIESVRARHEDLPRLRPHRRRLSRASPRASRECHRTNAPSERTAARGASAAAGTMSRLPYAERPNTPGRDGRRAGWSSCNGTRRTCTQPRPDRTRTSSARTESVRSARTRTARA